MQSGIVYEVTTLYKPDLNRFSEKESEMVTTGHGAEQASQHGKQKAESPG